MICLIRSVLRKVASNPAIGSFQKCGATPGSGDNSFNQARRLKLKQFFRIIHQRLSTGIC